jgi:hypothetical protein
MAETTPAQVVGSGTGDGGAVGGTVGGVVGGRATNQLSATDDATAAGRRMRVVVVVVVPAVGAHDVAPRQLAALALNSSRSWTPPNAVMLSNTVSANNRTARGRNRFNDLRGRSSRLGGASRRAQSCYFFSAVFDHR